MNLKHTREKRDNKERHGRIRKIQQGGSLTQLFGDCRIGAIDHQVTDACKVNNRLVSFQEGDPEAKMSIDS
jgi:hypothetical protein